MGVAGAEIALWQSKRLRWFEAGRMDIEVSRHESEHGHWELVQCRPDSRLRGFVHGYEGYTESAFPGPVLRQELPSLRIPVIVNFGAGWRVSDANAGPTSSEVRDSFVAGLSERSSFVVAEGAASCIQIDFTPIGAHLFLGVPMHELANREVDLHDLLGRGATVVERLEALRSWEERFALVEQVILSRFAGAPRPAPEILWAWRALEQAEGQLRVDTLAERLGRNRRQLLGGFRDQVGLAPKTVARIMRFDQAVQLLRRGEVTSFADLAQDCGYFDQAHLIRDFRQFAGVTPTKLARRFVPDVGFLPS